MKNLKDMKAVLPETSCAVRSIRGQRSKKLRILLNRYPEAQQWACTAFGRGILSNGQGGSLNKKGKLESAKLGKIWNKGEEVRQNEGVRILVW